MDGMHPDRPVGFNSPFLFPDKDGKGVFDLQKYLDKHNNGKAPDVVSFQLGLNDILMSKPHNIVEKTEKSIQEMEVLIAEFRKLKPAPEILIFQHIPGADQDAFGANYACNLTTWQYRKHLDIYNRALLKKGKELNINVVPIYMNIDTENNMKFLKQPVNVDNPRMIMRANNGVHPAREGYRQMADTLYCYVKAVLDKTDKK
jgi:lysophospholipase L1-like esterase